MKMPQVEEKEGYNKLLIGYCQILAVLRKWPMGAHSAITYSK